MIPNNIFLTGFMGSGKSSVGPILARKMDFLFLDTDRVVEQEVGLTVAQIFDKRGEDFFRQSERRALRNLARGHGQIISLGGGTLKDSESLSLVLETGKLVYLFSTPEALAKRLEVAKVRRPILSDLTGEALEAKVRELLKDRIQYYERAHLKIETANKNTHEIADEIFKKLVIEK